MAKFDVIIIGGGPGGYVAAIRAAKEGKKTALVEQDLLGGTCLNRGCIPSKTLLGHAEVIENIKKGTKWGIEVPQYNLQWNKMHAHKEEVIQTLRNGVTGLMQAGKIEVYQGKGTVLPNKQVQVVKEDTTEEIIGDNIIVATGSQPVVPPITGLDQTDFHTTDTIFDIDKIPSSLVIVGGGVIGVELADVFSSLDTKVTIVEMGDRLIPTEDEAAAKLLQKQLKKKGVEILVNHQMMETKELPEEMGKEVIIKNSKDKEKTLSTEALLIAVGRAPNTEAVKNLNLKMNRAFIEVNDYLETSEPGVFAVGDVIGNYQLAHVASAEGMTAVANLEKLRKKQSYKTIPRCVYTSPQVASVGYTETELKEKGIQYQVHQYDFSGNGMALATGETNGFSKVMIDERYGEILGVVMVGSHVTEMISQSSAYMFLEGTVEELADMVQPHPSLSEALMESANALLGKNIHS